MKEYWEITHDRAVPTQAVWGLQPAFELNNLTRAQHGTLTESLPTLAQFRDTAENNLTDALSAKGNHFTKLLNLAIRQPGLADGLLEDGDPLKDQLDKIFAVDADVSEAHTLRRCRLILPFWTDLNTARAAMTPPKLALTLDYLGVAVTVADFSTTMNLAIVAQQAESDRQRDVTTAKGALRAADRKLDRANKRWYQAWLKAYPEGTPEGDAALSDIPTEQGTAQAQKIEILTLTPLADHTVRVNLDPDGGAHASTKELQTMLPGETEFGHTIPITGNEMILGPYPAGTALTARTRVANSNPGTVTSTPKSVVTI
ncbi:MAG: hypothetical protein RL514_3054 [Verrucomicrobiota bacterium]|jgi:hypothetical protein